MHKSVLRIRNHVARLLLPLLLRPADCPSLIRLGTAYGGWWIPKDGLDAQSICYLAGVGTDISFDLALVERYGCCVWGIDPTPAAITWLEGQVIDERYAHVPLGLAGEPGELKFYAPSDPSHVSHSIKNLHGTDTFFSAEVTTVAGLMRELKHNHLTLLKLDIEGAEHDTIRTMLGDGIYPDIICVEFDPPEPLRWAVNTSRALRAHGYQVVKVELFNVTLIRQVLS